MSTTAVYDVIGMTCAHCVSAVTAEILELEGVSAVEIELEPRGTSTVTVSSEAPLDDDAVRAAVDEAGYEVL